VNLSGFDKKMCEKRILKYLKETINAGLWYPRESSINLTWT